MCEFLPLSEETLNKEQSIFDKAVFKQSKFMHNHLVAREVGCDYLIKAEHAIRIMNFARLMYRNKNCSEMKEATDLVIDGLVPKAGTYLADVQHVMSEFGIAISDAIISPEAQAREFRSKIRCHTALLRQKDLKEKAKTHEWREETQPSASAKMCSLFFYSNSVALFHFRLPFFDFTCLKGMEIKDDPRDDCSFCGSKNSNNGRHKIYCKSLPDNLLPLTLLKWQHRRPKEWLCACGGSI
eukprot:GHVP01019262.1.p1 GENE.GHVP01019262.1~~GHVP01019262.1.p1  ORF type:complete len:240 (+),score=38.09 GHVP01019262.1:603-1322(+)